MAIPAYRLPPDVESGARGGPEFHTIIQEAIAGNEQRIAQWAKCRGRWDIAYGMVSEDVPAVIAVFKAHFGKLSPFRFKDWSDYEATDERFGTGDGSDTTFQLTKTYDPGAILGFATALTYVRNITLPVGSPIIKVNGVTQTVTTHYTIGSTGIVTFVSAPANGHAITWTGEFDVPVRFDTDHLPIVMHENSLVATGSIIIREVVGET